MFIPAFGGNGFVRCHGVFQSRDWVDVYSGFPLREGFVSNWSFNPATGLMFIPADQSGRLENVDHRFQSRDWVDVYSGNAGRSWSR